MGHLVLAGATLQACRRQGIRYRIQRKCTAGLGTQQQGSGGNGGGGSSQDADAMCAEGEAGEGAEATAVAGGEFVLSLSFL